MKRGDKSAEPPSKDRFAELMAEALRAAGEPAELHYQAEPFSLSAGDEDRNIFYLHNAYREYCAAPKGQRAGVIRRFVRSWFSRHKEVPAAFEDVQPDLLPVVRGRGYFSLTCLQTEIEDMPAPDWPHFPLAEHFAVGLVYDLPESIMQVQQHHLTGWGVEFDEALEAARVNLRALSREEFESPAPGVWQSPWRDNHDAARLVLDDVLDAQGVEGDPVVMIPNRDTLLLTGADDDEGLTGLAVLAEKAFEHPRPLTGIALRRTAGGWVPFLPDPDHPEYHRFRLLRVQTLGRDYADQANLLQALHEKIGEDVFVASYSALRSQDTGAVRTYCVWSEGVDTLLPEADEVYFFRPDDKDDGEVVGSASWERVRQVLGSLLVPQGLYPERYRVRDFPTAEQLAGLLTVWPPIP